MGMFDTIIVKKELLEDLLKEKGLTFEEWEGEYGFQTKDLDNALATFVLQADGTLTEKRQETVWVEPKPKTVHDDDSWLTSMGYLESVGDPYYVDTNYTTYVTFYDGYATETERIWVDFVAHFKDGKLTEPIKISNIERTNLKEEQERTKGYRRMWEAVRHNWKWKAADLIDSFLRPFQKIERKISNLSNSLREQARKESGLEF
jgi:hypothetical protein